MFLEPSARQAYGVWYYLFSKQIDNEPEEGNVMSPLYGIKVLIVSSPIYKLFNWTRETYTHTHTILQSAFGVWKLQVTLY